MKTVALARTKLSNGTQRDLGRIREIARFNEKMTRKFHPDLTVRAASEREIQRIVERIARREVSS